MHFQNWSTSLNSKTVNWFRSFYFQPIFIHKGHKKRHKGTQMEILNVNLSNNSLDLISSSFASAVVDMNSIFIFDKIIPTVSLIN